MHTKKLVIIINGRGGVGKDTLCDIANEALITKSVSSIDPVKEVAKVAGWNGEKTPEARKFLSELKKLMIAYNDRPTAYLVEKYEEFKKTDETVLFCHIREGEEIDKLKSKIENIKTLLIRRNTEMESWGNKSDDEVENYRYDYIYDNNVSLKDTKEKFIEFMMEILKDNMED